MSFTFTHSQFTMHSTYVYTERQQPSSSSLLLSSSVRQTKPNIHIVVCSYKYEYRLTQTWHGMHIWYYGFIVVWVRQKNQNTEATLPLSTFSVPRAQTRIHTHTHATTTSNSYTNIFSLFCFLFLLSHMLLCRFWLCHVAIG